MTDTHQADSSTEQLLQQVPTGIRMVTSRLRSVNLERDSDLPGIGPVYMSARIVDALSRLAEAMNDAGRNRAWSLTGPYGSGKSTIALLITDLLGQSSSRRNEAEQLLATADLDLARELTAARDRIAPEGFITAITTARRESVPSTLHRALARGAERRWPDGTAPRKVSTSLRALRRLNASGAEILAALKTLCEEAPVLLVVDEFGKVLEYLASEKTPESTNDDVYALQEVAEAGAGPHGLPLFTLTLQHLSFLDYSAHSTALQRREWAKVQGRFEDITFTSDPGDSVQFIRQSIIHDGLSDSARELVQSHGAASAVAWSRLGMQSILPANASLFAALYPLHPLTAAVAPLVAAQVGQNDRSLAGFLVSDEPWTVERFVANYAATDVTEASTVKLPQLYDYFFTSGRTTMLASAAASRWIEIDLILSEARGLDEQDLQILKAIGILNLIDASGAMRACAGSVLFALNDPLNDDEARREDLLVRLERLTERGFLVYREFNDEYRIWRGSAIDLRSVIAEARERCDNHTVVKMLGKLLPVAVIAGRHSQRTGMLRHFITMVSDPSTGTVADTDMSGSADGILVFHFGADRDVPDATSAFPVVVGTSEKTAAVVDAGREVIALEEVLTTGNLDAAALREITERAGQARAQLAAVMAAAFTPSKPWTRWLLLNARRYDPENGSETSLIDLKGRSLARIVSEACDIRYEHTPHIRNEMLGRHQLTSQGAKARRELITGMLTQASSPRLGIIGYGPERAIYDGVLAYLGLHGPTKGKRDPSAISVKYELTEPDHEGSLGPAWAALRREITKSPKEIPVNELFRLLMMPPFGLKAGVVPVIMAAALTIGRGEIALFEEGTYQPFLTPDLMERLIKAPNRYSVKYSPSMDGQRYLVLEKITEVLHITQAEKRSSPDRNSALLNVTRELLNQVRGLTAYAASTARLSEHALAVRKVLRSARDPDELIFTTLPHVLGIPLVPVGGKSDNGLAAKFALRLSEALTEIRNADETLRAEVTRVLANEFRLPDDIPTMRSALAARASAFAGQIGEPELSGFISLALNQSLADEEWLDPVVVRIVHAGLPSWSDSHLAQFKSGARRIAKALDRLAHLYEPSFSAEQSPSGQVRLVSVTDHDGHEERILIHVPDTIRSAASLLAAELADIADKRLGADGRRILLAELASSLATSDKPR
jgi:hypothetical protein